MDSNSAIFDSCFLRCHLCCLGNGVVHREVHRETLRFDEWQCDMPPSEHDFFSRTTSVTHNAETYRLLAALALRHSHAHRLSLRFVA